VEEEARKQKKLSEKLTKNETETKPVPAFSPEQVTVVFVLGGITDKHAKVDLILTRF
jgi:UMP-CMP kinase